MFRRDILIELGKADLLTPERAEKIRGLAEVDLQRELVTWGQLPPAVFKACGIWLMPKKTTMPMKEAEGKLRAFLMTLPVDDCEVLWVTPEEARSISLNKWWTDRLAHTYPEWLGERCHTRVATTLATWRELIPLAERHILVYGLDNEWRLIATHGEAL